MRTNFAIWDHFERRHGVPIAIGTPRRVQDFLGRFIEEIGDVPTFYFAGAFQWGDIAYGEALESMQIFAEEVMPLFKTQELRDGEQ